MAIIASAVETDFTPAVGDFNVQVTGGTVTLLRRNTSGAAASAIQPNFAGAWIVSNPVAGAVYRFAVASGTPVVQADQ